MGVGWTVMENPMHRKGNSHGIRIKLTQGNHSSELGKPIRDGKDEPVLALGPCEGTEDVDL